MASELEHAVKLDPAFDEAWSAAGIPRDLYADLLSALDGVDLSGLQRSVAARLASDGVSFGGGPFVVDPIPRLISETEWRRLELGLAQRARALNCFLHDAYGAREIVHAGNVPLTTIEEAEGFEPDVFERLPDHRWPAAIIGFDVVRNPDGEYLVLEDNVRTPSGFSYALAARAALIAELPEGVPTPLPTDPVAWSLLRDVVLAAVPAGRVGEPTVVVLTDGPESAAHYEHVCAARALGAILAVPEDLVRDGTDLLVREAGGTTTPVDVVYRRTSDDGVRDEAGELTDSAAKLLEPWLTGSIGLVNAYGNGLADDKLVHSHVEDFIRFYLDETPLIRSVPTTHVEAESEAIIARLDELVVKPRHGHGGIGVVIGPHATEEDRAILATELRRDPSGHIAQPTVTLSVHPTVIDGQLQPRHVDLRPFSFAGSDVRLMPGGLSRVAFEPGALVVNSSQTGGGKDTWVVPD
jgi:uncharacterized circularly permuted ATP-grasp superfamily protein